MSTEALTWIAGDDSTYSLYSIADGDRGIMGIEGIGLPTLEHTGQPYPCLHGMLDIARRFRDRTVLIPWQRQFTGRASWQAGRRALGTALNPDLGKGQLKFVDVSGNDWRLDAWVVNAPLERRAEWGPWEIRTVLEFWVPWPFWRKASAETDTDDFDGASNVDIAIANDGNLPTIPTTIVLEAGGGETIVNPVLTIVATGKKISLDHTISAGETVTVTCFPPEDASIKKDGTGIEGDLSYDSVLVGFEIPRGNQTVRIVGEAGDTGNCLITFWEWFLSV